MANKYTPDMNPEDYEIVFSKTGELTKFTVVSVIEEDRFFPFVTYRTEPAPSNLRSVYMDFSSDDMDQHKYRIRDKTRKRTVWVNLFKDEQCAYVWDSEEDAIDSVDSDDRVNLIGTFPIEYEE